MFLAFLNSLPLTRTNQVNMIKSSHIRFSFNRANIEAPRLLRNLNLNLLQKSYVLKTKSYNPQDA